MLTKLVIRLWSRLQANSICIYICVIMWFGRFVIIILGKTIVIKYQCQYKCFDDGSNYSALCIMHTTMILRHLSGVNGNPPVVFMFKHRNLDFNMPMVHSTTLRHIIQVLVLVVTTRYQQSGNIKLLYLYQYQ